MKKVLLFAVLFALVAVRQSHADTNSDQAERAVVMMEEIATIIDTNKDKCDAMGDQLSAYLDKNGDELKKLKAAGKSVSDEQKKAFSEKYKARMQAVISKMATGLRNCGKNAKVNAAMARATGKA